jgi:hypothetical protein
LQIALQKSQPGNGGKREIAVFKGGIPENAVVKLCEIEFAVVELALFKFTVGELAVMGFDTGKVFALELDPGELHTLEIAVVRTGIIVVGAFGHHLFGFFCAQNTALGSGNGRHSGHGSVFFSVGITFHKKNLLWGLSF